MLEHGFVSVNSPDSPASAPVVEGAGDGGAVLQILPPGWNTSADVYTFGYIHPLRQSQESFTIKALTMGQQLVVHAASSVPGGDLLTLNIDIQIDAPADSAAVVGRAKIWHEKMSSNICARLLQRQNSTAKLGKFLAQDADTAASSSAKRPAPPDAESPASRRPPDGHPMPDPFSPTFSNPFFGDTGPLIWTPDRSGGSMGGGMLIGPRHPAWGQAVPGRFGGSGMMPRWDPIGPGSGEPDNDLLPVHPGWRPDNFPAFQGGASGAGRRLDPDGMFMM
jgi:hypothetical protein